MFNEAIELPGENAALTTYTSGYKTPKELRIRKIKTITVLKFILRLVRIYNSPSLKDLVRLKLNTASGAKTMKIITASTDA